MQTQRKIKTERHHWWPKCVSQHWKNENGKVHWLQPNGETKEVPPKELASIRNVHTIKLGRKAGEITPWDQNFEQIFDNADGRFPSVVSWLQSLKRKDVTDAKTLTDRFIPQNASDEQIAQLVESMVSLAIRSPMQRQTGVRAADAIRGDNKALERKRSPIAALNMRDGHQRTISKIGTRGKFVVLCNIAVSYSQKGF